MGKQKTAVEILMEEITYDDGYGQRLASFIETVDLLPYFQKALALEKEQMVDFYVKGCAETYGNDEPNEDENYDKAEAKRYYNEKFKTP